MRARRTTSVVAVVAALAVGQWTTDKLPFDAEDRAPFLRAAKVGEAAHLEYADVTVTDVRPARHLSPQLSDSLARLPGGVYVLVSVEVTATREPVNLLSTVVVDRDGREYQTSKRATCDTIVSAPTGLPTYALFCFDVPTSRLAGLRFRTARGQPILDATRGDAMSDVDLGISAADAERWADTEAAYLVPTSGLTPFELETVTLDEVAS